MDRNGERLREWAFACYEAGAVAMLAPFAAYRWHLLSVSTTAWLTGIALLVLQVGLCLRILSTLLGATGRRRRR
jgi:hypothetical protein